MVAGELLGPQRAILLLVGCLPQLRVLFKDQLCLKLGQIKEKKTIVALK